MIYLLLCGILKSLTIIVLLSIFSFKSINISFVYLDPLMGAYTYINVVSFAELTHFSLCNVLLCLLLQSSF